jgi:hypothetical protein
MCVCVCVCVYICARYTGSSSSSCDRTATPRKPSDACQPAFAVGLSSRGTGEGDVVGDCSPSRSNEQGEKKTRPRDLESAWIFGELDLKVDDDFRGVFFTDLSSPRVSRTSRGQSNRAKWESLRSGRAFIKVRIESVGSLIFQ